MPPRKKKVDDDAEPLARLPSSSEYGGTALMSATDERRERELEDVLTEIGTDGRIRVWHVIDGKSVYAGEMSLDGFTLDALLEHYGGGDKTLVFYQGRKRVETLRVTLDPSIPATNPKEQKLIAQREAARANGGGGTNMGEMASFLAAMAQSQMSNMDMFAKMMMMQQSSSQAMIQAVTAMMTARPDKDPTDMALKIAEILKPNGGGAGVEMLTAFREGLNMARDLSGRDDDGDDTSGLIGKGLDVVGKALEAAKAPTMPAQQRLLPSPTPATPVPPTMPTPKPSPDDPTTPHTGDRPWIVAARPMIPRLAGAIAFLSGDSAAVELLRRASDDVVQDLMDDLDDETPPGFMGRVQALFPMFQPSPEWSQQFIETLRASIEEEDESIEAGEPQELIDAARAANRGKK